MDERYKRVKSECERERMQKRGGGQTVVRNECPAANAPVPFTVCSLETGTLCVSQ
jgi:hypothetical protein